MSDIYDINTIEPGGNRICWGCGSRHRRLQWVYRYGSIGWYCTAQFTCEEDREDAPVCVYCESHYIPEAHRYCPEGPTIDGVTAHSTVDERPRLEAEKKKREEDERRKKQLAENQDQKLTPEEYLRKILTSQLSIKGSAEDATQQLKRIQKTLEKIDSERLQEKKKKLLDKQMLETRLKENAPRGTVIVDHADKKRYVSTGEGWLEVSELAWAEWNKRGFNLDKIPGEFEKKNEVEIFKNDIQINTYNDLLYGKNDYYSQIPIQSQHFQQPPFDDDWWIGKKK